MPNDDLSVVYVVDDDHDMRDSLAYLVRSVGLPVCTFASAQAFLKAVAPEQAGCLVCDVRMPEVSGLELQERMIKLMYQMPMIVMTAHADVPMAVRALKSGAVEFLEKPFNPQHLLERIQAAIDADRGRRRDYLAWCEVRQRLASLTQKEEEALALVLEGEPNKNIAVKLGIAERTVELRRASIMKKMDVHSLAELVRMVVEHRGSSFSHRDVSENAPPK